MPFRRFRLARLYLSIITVAQYKSVSSNRTLHLGVCYPTLHGAITKGYSIFGAVLLAVGFVRNDSSFAYFRSKGYDLDCTITDCPCDVGAGLDSFAKLYVVSDPPSDVFIGNAIYTTKTKYNTAQIKVKLNCGDFYYTMY